MLVLIAVAGGVLSGIAITAPAIVATLTRMAYGFTSTGNLIALCLLDRSGYVPPLPGRLATAGARSRQLVGTSRKVVTMPSAPMTRSHCCDYPRYGAVWPGGYRSR